MSEDIYIVAARRTPIGTCRLDTKPDTELERDTAAPPGAFRR